MDLATARVLAAEAIGTFESARDRPAENIASRGIVPPNRDCSRLAYRSRVGRHSEDHEHQERGHHR
jgi:hypothetical protein